MAYYSRGIGLVCRGCADDIRVGVKALAQAKIRGVYAGACPDNRKGGTP